MEVIWCACRIRYNNRKEEFYMMKKHFTIRLMALMLAALMMGAAFSACSQTQQTEQTEQTQETQTAEKTEDKGRSVGVY